MTDTTLMMVTYNRLDLTKETLHNLFRDKITNENNAGRNFNLVIVDNGSSDGTVKYLESWHSAMVTSDCDFLGEVRVIYLPENKGIAIGRNIALKTAAELGTKWFCTIDNDVKLPTGWLQEAIEIMEANKPYCAIGVNFETETFPEVTKNGFTFQEKPAGNLGTACMVFKKQLHQMLGYFNTEYGMYGEEDADFGMRARVAGFRMGYIKENGEHLGADEEDVNEYREFKTKQHADNLALFKKNCALYAQRKKAIYIPYKD